MILKEPMRFRNAILFTALAVAWGSAFTAIKTGLEFFPPVLFAAFRYDIAGVLMLGYAVYVTDRWIPRSRNEWVLVGIGGAFMIAAYHAFLFIGEQGNDKRRRRYYCKPLSNHYNGICTGFFA